MFGWLEVIGGVFGLFDATATLTRREERTTAASLVLFIALLAVVLSRADGPLEREDVGWACGLFAAEVAAALLVITLLHAIRPVGQDLPVRRWTETYTRCAGPLALIVFGALLLVPWFDEARRADWPLAAVIAGGALCLLGAAVTLRQARAAF